MARSVKLGIDEDASPGSSDLVVGNFGDRSEQILIMFDFLGHFSPREKT